MDFGAYDSVVLCLYLDDGISETRARRLIEEAWRDEAGLYGLGIRVAHVAHWRRPAFTIGGIMAALRHEPIPAGCDRVLALVGRHAGDVAWGLLLLPEVLGAVNDETLTHGYVVVPRVTINQVFVSAPAIVRHELYHMLGCDTHFDMARCYEQIARLKRARQGDFFPAWDRANQCLLVSREEVRARLDEGGKP